MFTKVAKMITAADETSNSTAEAIAALRNQLSEGTDISVTPDGGVTNPEVPQDSTSLNSGSGFKPVEKSVVAANDNSTADAIAALRKQLEGGGEIEVNQDGTVRNPADPMSESSLASGTGFKPVDKAVVATENNTTAEAIAALRNQLSEGTDVSVTPDGGVTNPEVPQDSTSLNSGLGFKPVEKSVVAANDNSTADAIAALRQQLEGGGEIEVNQDGTVRNPADPMSESSLASGTGFKPVDKAVVAMENNTTAEAIAALRNQLSEGTDVSVAPDGGVTNPEVPQESTSLNSGSGFKPVEKSVVAAQWYQTNPALQRAEIAAMADIQPGAKMGYLPNGNMYWTVRLRPVVCGSRKDWTLLAVYDPDHPQQRWGGSVKFYPVKPNFQEMMDMVRMSAVTPKSIPHLLRDGDDQIYMCTQDKNNIHAGSQQGELVTTAASCLRFAMRWITVFELGLIDQKTWSLFQDHGKI